MSTEKAGQEKCKVRDKLLVSAITLSVCLLQVHRQGNDVGDFGQSLGEHEHQLLVIVVGGTDLQATNLRQTLEGDVSELGDIQETGQKSVDNGCLEDVAQRDPVQEAKKGLKGSLDKTGLVCGVENLGTKLKDRGEFLGHGGLEVPCLDRGHLVLREVKDFLGQQAKDGHVVFANGKTGMA